jgi:uncharacterized protein YegL
MADLTIPDVALQDNNSQRLPCILVVDGSGSMGGAPINELNAGLKVLEDELKKDDIARQRVQISVIRFGDLDQTEVLCDWVDAMAFSAPYVNASGQTPMGKAVGIAMQKIEEQKQRYKAHGIAYNRPWLFLMTDGEPTDAGWEHIADQCRTAEQAEKFIVWAIGVGRQADLSKLGRFSNRAPAKLNGLKFKELFLWLSRSASSASQAAQKSTVQLAAPTDWMQAPS